MHILSLHHVWSDWKIRAISAAAGMIVCGVISAMLTPRGPVTSSQALISIALALAIGVVAGFITGSYWSALIAPIVFVIAFELSRSGLTGPTVDAIHLGSTYGIIAFAVGRFFHAIIVLLPMMIGAVLGVWYAARLNDSSAGIGIVGWASTGLATLGLIIVVIYLARPAKVQPIVGPDGASQPGSISEILTLPIGGQDQVVMIRGRSIDHPVLLYLAGGPGGTDLGAMRADVTLEQHFMVVTWEQRGTGKSYAALEPVDTLTLNQMIADTIELTNYLRKRFDEDKIFLVGNSWGTILGTLVAQQHPELFHAYVGTGQMVSPKETDVMFYEDTLAWAEKTGNVQLANTLRLNGPPPYANLLDYEPALSHEHDWNPYPYLDVRKEMPANLFVPENTFIDRINALRGFLDTFSVLYPQLQTIDFRRDVQRLEVPVVLVIGEYEARGRSVLAYEWFEGLEAPAKEMIVFEKSGHRPLFEEPSAFVKVMEGILESTYTK